MSVPISASRRRALVRTDSVDLGEVDTGQVVQRGANLESGFIVPWLLSRAGRGHRAARSRRLGGQREKVGLDRRIARSQLLLIHVDQREVLLQHKDVFRTVVPGERRRDLGLRGLTPVVPMLREHARIRLVCDDVTENAQPGDARDIADHEGELEIHLDERLLHALNVRGRALHQGLAVSKVGAQGSIAAVGRKLPRSKPTLLQLLQPLAVHDVGFPPRDILRDAR
jgi:hypothetical protein